MSVPIAFILGSAVLAIVYGVVLSQKVLKMSAGNDRMQAIARAIQEGAKAYLNRQYKTVAMVAVVLFFVIGFVP
ncbi:MAG TPA: sodium/proton-translocating pyrophosphatase, partial [Candidatus Kapabacteria bacterium]|nr:sodium/proton-translocating pyrophosphatase [Candidatus Kapabacteria bacterium]